MEDMLKVFNDNGFPKYRMIGWSKSGYRNQHQGHEILFNANIFTYEDKWVWGGDLNLTLDAYNLQQTSSALDKELIVTSEMMGRFGAEERPIDEIVDTCHAIFSPNKTSYQRRVYSPEFEATVIGGCTFIGSKREGFNEIEITQPE